MENNDDNSDFYLKPIFAYSSFFISKNGLFSQMLTFEYKEESGNYMYKIETDDNFYQNEINNIWNNMQFFMDQTNTYVNDKNVFPKVVDVEIEFKDEYTPLFYWIINFKTELNKGFNIYKSEFEKEILDYDAISIYILEPPLKIKRIESSMKFEINEDKNIIKYYGFKGDFIGPEEIIEFINE